MYLYSTPRYTRSRLEKTLQFIELAMLHAIMIVYLIVTTNFTLRANNTFSNAFASLSETRIVADSLQAVLEDCSVVARLKVDFAPVEVHMTSASAPLTLSLITGQVCGILIMAGVQIVVSIALKYSYAYNVQYLRIGSIWLPYHLLLITADVGLCAAVVAVIGTSSNTFNFLRDYVDLCADQLRTTNITKYNESDVDTDVVFGVPLYPLLGVCAANLILYGVQVCIKFFFAYNEPEIRLAKAQYPYLGSGVLAIPKDPLLLEYNLLREAKVQQLKKDPEGTNPIFVPILTAEYLDEDGHNFTFEASLTLDDMDNRELRKTIVQSMVESCDVSRSAVMQVPRTFVVGADPDDPVAQRELKMRRTRAYYNRIEQQRKAQEGADVQFREQQALRARMLGQKKKKDGDDDADDDGEDGGGNNNRQHQQAGSNDTEVFFGRTNNAANNDVTQAGQAWDPSEDDRLSNPSQQQQQQQGAVPSPVMGYQQQQQQSPPHAQQQVLSGSSVATLTNMNGGNNLFNANQMASPLMQQQQQQGAGGGNDPNFNNYNNNANNGFYPNNNNNTNNMMMLPPPNAYNSGYESQPSQRGGGAGSDYYDDDGTSNHTSNRRGKKDKKDKKKDKAEKKKSKKDKHGGRRGGQQSDYDSEMDPFTTGGPTGGSGGAGSYYDNPNSASSSQPQQQVFAYYDADGNLLGEGTTLEGLDDDEYVIAEYDEDGNLVNVEDGHGHGGEYTDGLVSSDGGGGGGRHHRSSSSKKKKDKKDKHDGKRDGKKEKKDKTDKKERKSHTSSRRDSRAAGNTNSPAMMRSSSVGSLGVVTSATDVMGGGGGGQQASSSNNRPHMATSSTTVMGPRSIPAPRMDDDDDDDDEAPIAPPPMTSRLTAAQNRML